LPGVRFIINADDFGKNRQVNEAVIKCFNEGFLSSASILMNGSGYNEAVEFMKAHKYSGVGIHLNLTEGSPVTSNLKRIPSLIKGDGSLLDNKQLRKKSLKFTVPYRQIYTELENQILEFLKFGIKPSHIDSHHHVHTIPLVALAVTKLAKKYGISRIRPSLNFLKGIKVNRRSCFFWPFKSAYKKIINSFFRKHFIMPDFFWGGGLKQILNNDGLLKNLSMGTYLLSCHPDFDNIGSHELDILTNRNLPHTLSGLGIKLISFSEL